ncbi:AMP-binding protein [Cupriavidus sp. PET2-C1]
MAHPSHYAQTMPEKIAAVFIPGGREITYSQLEDGANRVANLLRSAGIKTGDAVLFCVENCPEFLYLGWGCQRAGVVFTPVSTKLSADDLRYIARDCGARCVRFSGRRQQRGSFSVRFWFRSMFRPWGRYSWF